ncbi:ribonuclease H-like domain-containing protein [Tanacetum coccineum]
MADLTFVDSHNIVAYLEKSEDNADFAEIVDFLNASPMRYALTVSTTIYVSYIEQFWSTTNIKTINNETQIRAKVDGKTIVIKESSVRRDLHFDDEDDSFNALQAKYDELQSEFGDQEAALVAQKSIVNTGEANVSTSGINSGSVYVNSVTQIKSAASRVNTGKRYINSGCVYINTARVNRPVSNKPSPKPSQVKFNSQNKYFSAQSSPVNRPFSRNTAYKSNTYAVKGKMGTAVKTSAGCVWRKSTPLSNTNSGPTPDSYVHDHPLKHMEHRGIFDSGCSGHMTGNRAHLEDYQELSKVGSVTFGGSKGSISGKGTIRLGNLVFDDVAFVKELGHFNLFSISQICDKKLNVLFTEKECFVVSSDFKMPDANQVLLKVPRQHNMYTFDMKNVDSSKGYTCLLAKASSNEAKLWHRRLGHLNFKNLNKLVKDNLVRGLPSKSFKNDHTCVACQKGKQHKASSEAEAKSPLPPEAPATHVDMEAIAKKERTRLEELLKSKGMPHGFYPRFTVAVKGQKVTIKFQIPSTCEIALLISKIVANLGVKVKERATGLDMEIEFLKQGSFTAEEFDALVSMLKLAGSGHNKITDRKGETTPTPSMDKSIAGLEGMGDIEDTILLALQSPEVYDEIARRTRCKFETNRPRVVLFEGPPVSINEIKALYDIFKRLSYVIIEYGHTYKEEFRLALFSNSSMQNLCLSHLKSRKHEVIEFDAFVRLRSILHPDAPESDKNSILTAT